MSTIRCRCINAGNIGMSRERPTTGVSWKFWFVSFSGLPEITWSSVDLVRSISSLSVGTVCLNGLFQLNLAFLKLRTNAQTVVLF